jgi:Protein of unknown function (DUF2934)
MAISVTPIQESAKRLLAKSAEKAKSATRPTRPEPVQPGSREEMIAEVAYYRAEKRGFEPGYELEDWLAAEQEIDALVKAAA